MANIKRLIGVCPQVPTNLPFRLHKRVGSPVPLIHLWSLLCQFDVLWDALSGEEHLRLFSSIKGLPASTINSVLIIFYFENESPVKCLFYLLEQSHFLVMALQATKTSLAEVKLAEAAKMRAGSYSGGMKRRLSVAISLVADPKVIFLDEPVNFPLNALSS